MLLECISDRLAEIIRLPRLCVQARKLTLIDCSCRGRQIGVPGQHDASDVRPTHVDGAQQFGAVHTGHRVVAQHRSDRSCLLLQHRQRVLTPTGRQHPHSVRAQQPAQRGQDARLVVDDENTGLHCLALQLQLVSHYAATASPTVAGSRTVTRVPRPGVLSNTIVPLWRVTIP